jgi:hypothetical protein
MKRSQEAQAVEMIPVDRITVINPLVRNKKIFNEIISNIGELGLKKPITVTRRADADGPRYDLVCGQGRLEAYQEDVDRKRLLIRKAETTRNRLIFVTEAVRKLLIDENFLTLLQAEGLDTLPRNLAARIEVGAQT